MTFAANLRVVLALSRRALNEILRVPGGAVPGVLAPTIFMIVLSGVFSHDEQKAVSKLPGLGHIPIVGELFKSRAFDSTKRELVIFVTTRIVNPDSDKIRTIIEDVKGRYKQARSEVNFNIFD